MYTKLSPNRGPALINPIWCVVHTAQGARTDESLAAFLGRSSSGVSYHYICDDDSETQCVPEDQQSWSALGANRRGIHLCTTGFAEWSRDEWLSHPVMLGFLADRIGEVSRRRGFPIAHLSDQQTRNGESGSLGHGDYSRATGDGDHTDPGPNFPWDVVLARASGNPTEEDSMSAADVAQIMTRIEQVVSWEDSNFRALAAQAESNRNMLAAYLRDATIAAVASVPGADTKAISAAVQAAVQAAVSKDYAITLTQKPVA